jgi:hypothetical protein
MASDVHRGALKNFQRFIDEQGDVDDVYFEPGERFRYLGNWIKEWLRFGDGVEFTGRNYETYLRVCLDIADAALCGQVDFSRLARTANLPPVQIDGIDNPHDPTDYADRAIYEVAVTRWEHGGRGILAEDWSELRVRPPEPTEGTK